MKSCLKIYFLLLLLVLISCDDSFDADPVDPRLPSYSEIGKNEAGAFVNETPWVARITYDFYGASGGFLRLRVDEINKITYITISNGYLGYNDDPGIVGRTSIMFRLSDFAPKNLNELYSAGTRSFTLDGSANYGSLIVQYTDTITAGTGNLYIRNVSQSGSGIIYSGTFGFEIETDSMKYEVYQGRFDYTLESGDIQIIQ